MAKKQILQTTTEIAATAPVTTTTAAETAWNEVNHLRKGAIRLHVWLVTIFGFLQPYAIGWFEEADDLPQDAFGFYLAVFKITAPLTIGLSLWVMLLVATWDDDQGGGNIMLLGLAGGLILTVSAEIGNALGARRVEIVEICKSFGPLTGFINALYSYFVAYRGALFLSSVGIAGYAGYVFARYYFVAEKAVASLVAPAESAAAPSTAPPAQKAKSRSRRPRESSVRVA